MKNKNRKGFTLIELLVVIAIIAVLSVVVILSLNPAELLRQARDSNRISDAATLKSAISLYLADVTSPFIGTSTLCYVGISLASTTSPWTPNAAGTWVQTSATTTCGAWFVSQVASPTSTPSSTNRSVSNGASTFGLGWIPINFNNISSGAPIGSLPVDPINTAGTGNSRSAGAFFYSYIMSGTTFKLGVFTESTKYSTSGGGDIETSDGGVNTFVYEQGTALTTL